MTVKLDGISRMDRQLSKKKLEKRFKHQFKAEFKIFISRSNTKSIKYWNVNFGSFFKGFIRGMC